MIVEYLNFGRRSLTNIPEVRSPIAGVLNGAVDVANDLIPQRIVGSSLGYVAAQLRFHEYQVVVSVQHGIHLCRTFYGASDCGLVFAILPLSEFAIRKRLARSYSRGVETVLQRSMTGGLL